MLLKKRAIAKNRALTTSAVIAFVLMLFVFTRLENEWLVFKTYYLQYIILKCFEEIKYGRENKKRKNSRAAN